MEQNILKWDKNFGWIAHFLVLLLVEHIVFMHPQLPLQNFGMIVSGPHKKPLPESFLDGKYGMPLFKNQYEKLHNLLNKPWKFRMDFQLMK